MNRHSLITVLFVTVVVTSLSGQSPIQERILAARALVPPINQRIRISPIQDQRGAFSAVPTAVRTGVSGIVLNDLGDVVPSAGSVLLRSLQTGVVVSQTPVDAMGQFGLVGLAQGVYAAELVNGAGAVVTTTPAFTLSAGDSVQITPVIPSNSIAGVAALLGNSTSGAVNSAVDGGILAVATPAPVSPIR